MKRLLILAVSLSLVPLAAAKLELRKNKDSVQIVGGDWTLTYPTAFDFVPQLIELSPERAYFTQGGWLRLIDTTRGVVLGRWHLGPPVVAMKPAGDEQIEAEVADNSFRCKPYAEPGDCPETHDRALVGPGVRVPLLPSESLYWRGVGLRESMGGLPWFGFSGMKVKPERARELLPAAEQLARRDPYLPWARLIYAHLLAAAGDSRASAAFTDVLHSLGGDFTEWLPIAAYFYAQHQDQLARAAYDRGYKDYLQRGFDPRVLQVVWYRLSLFSPWIGPQPRLADLSPEQMDRIYRLSPATDLSWAAWEQYADDLEKRGYAADAQLWRARAADARQKAPALRTAFSVGLDRWFVAALAALAAMAVYVVVISLRYAPQRGADMEAGRRQWAVPLFSNLSYWNRTERLTLLLIALLGWLAMGIAGHYADALTHSEFAPAAVRNGSYAGQNARWHLQRLPASPERDLLLAIAYQQGGDSRRAEETYRRLPQFAQSWNNLGVLLKRRGKDDEARQAFQRALQLSPRLHDAAFNLDGSSRDYWTQLHREYLPDKPMLVMASGEQMRAAYLGGRGYSPFAWSALRGPFWPSGAYWEIASMGADSRPERRLRRGAEGVALAALLFALAMLLCVRHHQATEPAGPRHWIWELIIPGTAPAWSVAGGVVLVGYATCCLTVLSFITLGAPGLWTVVALYGVLHWYQQPAPVSIGPAAIWFIGVAAALLAVNAAIVMTTRHRAARPATAAVSQSS